MNRVVFAIGWVLVFCPDALGQGYYWTIERWESNNLLLSGVRDRLKIDPADVKKLNKKEKELKRRDQVLARKYRLLREEHPPAKYFALAVQRKKEQAELDAKAHKERMKLLTLQQRKQLKSLTIRLLGRRGMLDPVMRKQLKITDEQAAAIKKLGREEGLALLRIANDLRAKKLNREEHNQLALRAVRDVLRKILTTVLTSGQAAKWEKMAGDKVDDPAALFEKKELAVDPRARNKKMPPQELAFGPLPLADYQRKLARYEKVQTEIGLNDEEKKKVRAAVAQQTALRLKLEAAFNTARANFPKMSNDEIAKIQAAHRTAMLNFEKRSNADLQKLLTVAHRKRLRELSIRLQGIEALLVDEIRGSLALDEDQLKAIKELSRRNRLRLKNLWYDLLEDFLTEPDYFEAVRDFRSKMRARMRAVLSADQLRAFDRMRGKPTDLSHWYLDRKDL